MNKIAVIDLDKKYNHEVKKISALSRKIFLLLKKDGFSADIYFVSDTVMKKINRTYRKKNKPTNVLSFCEPEKFINAPSKFKYLGEIYVSLDFIKKHNQSISLMIVHGILHLLGYDHETAKERVLMEKKEDWLMKKI